MPVIVFASLKGGTGKTTSSFLLATDLAHRGFHTTLLDSDPNHPIEKWKERGGHMDHLSIKINTSEESILEDIDTSNNHSAFTVVDLEGTANLSVAYAMMRADLVIIPTQRSTLDAGEAAKTIGLVKRQSLALQQPIACSLLLTRTSPAIRSKGLKRMLDNLDTQKIDMFQTEIHEREAFKAVFDYSTTLHHLNASQVSGIEKAKKNIDDFSTEVIQKLHDLQKGDKAA
jgi:chromosome partitioning protein